MFVRFIVFPRFRCPLHAFVFPLSVEAKNRPREEGLHVLAVYTGFFGKSLSGSTGCVCLRN